MAASLCDTTTQHHRQSSCASHRASPQIHSFTARFGTIRSFGLLAAFARQWSYRIASYCVTQVLRGFRTLRHLEGEDGGQTVCALLP